MLPAYNKSKEMVIYDATSAMRAEESAELTIPENWSGDALAVYLSFQNEDNASVSNSMCVHNHSTIFTNITLTLSRPPAAFAASIR